MVADDPAPERSDATGRETLSRAPVGAFIAGAFARVREPALGTSPHLAGLPVLLGFAVVFGAMIAVVFPSKREYADFTARGGADAYSVAYLRVAVQATPRDRHLRLVYVRMLSDLGDYDAALDALAPALAESPRDVQVLTARFDLRLARMQAREEGSPARAAAARELAHDLEGLLDFPLDAAWLDRGARLARELGVPGLSARYRLREAQVVPVADISRTLLAAGDAFREVGDGTQAAAAYERAAADEPSLEQALPIALAATQAMEGADRVEDAAKLAERFMPRFGTHLEMIDRAITLDLRAGEPRKARDLGRIRLARVDTDAERFEQMRRELSAGDPVAAFHLLATLRARYPRDSSLRLVEARVAEWSGHPDIALADWLSLLGQPHLEQDIPVRWSPPR